MLLTKLELCGFKSFADKTQFDFRPGVTAFVGPNGCGKSNIVDAVRWILGEQRARAVRGTQMADVIFNGTSSRRSLGYAEASITFQNSQGVLPTEYTEVCVTRRLYRSGESEYMINRQPCRLRDIRTLFMDTGVGVDTYSIIEQGRVDKFIQANARERRMIFEEAAGISRYKAQRKEARSRLDRTAVNLQKVEIKLEEQRKQMRSIKYQAAKAKRFRTYSARLRELVVSLSVKNYNEWCVKKDAAAAEADDLEERNRGLTEETSRIETLMSQIEEELARIARTHLEKRDAFHQAEAQIEAAETSIRHNTQRIQEYRDESERTTRAVSSVTEKIEQTHAQMAASRRDLDSIRQTIQRQSEAIAAEVEEANVAASECGRLAGSIEEWKNRTLDIIERATTLRNDLNHMDAGRRQQFARKTRLSAQLEEKSAEVQRLEAEVVDLTGHREEISARLTNRGERLQARQKELEQVENHALELESRLRDERHQEARCLSRREILEDIELRAEDIESGVKRLLRNDDSAAAQINMRGMVADLIRADLKYARAIEAALGDSTQHVITTSEDEAGAAVALLRTDRSGRAGLIPLTRASGLDLSDLHLAGEPGVVGRASDLIDYEPTLEPVVRHLLGHTWVVEDLSVALGLSRNGGSEMRFVTLEGERVDPNGVIIGGEPLPGIGILSRKSELSAIASELDGITGRISSIQADRGRANERVASLRAETETLRAEIEQSNLDKVTNENEILNMRRRQKALAEESSVLKSEIDEIDEAVRGYDTREQELKQQLEETTRERDNLQTQVESAQRNLADQQAVVARLREQITRLKVELADKEARCGGLEQSIEVAQETVTDLESQIAASRTRLEELATRQAGAEQEIVKARQTLDQVGSQKQSLQAEIEALGADEARTKTSRDEHAQRAHALKQQHEQILERLQGLRLAEQEHRVRMEGLAERLFSEQGVRLEDALAQAATSETPEASEEAETSETPEEPVNWDEVKAEIESLRDKIRRMGGVNEEAIDEEAGLEIAIAETESQKDDLAKAEAHLRDVIRKLNRICREKFSQTFEEIRQNFQQTFRRVFGGGRADLALDPEEPDILEAGIDVLACPPGKELRSITLLSGGEKTMTTIALLFAIFRTKPSPFCIMDEIDAALDESNIDRFTGMVRDFVGDSQFIIITHSKRTLGIADVLYGITMQEKGVSKKVSVEFDNGHPSQN